MKLHYKIGVACALAVAHAIEQHFPHLGVIGDVIAVMANLFWLFLG